MMGVNAESIRPEFESTRDMMLLNRRAKMMDIAKRKTVNTEPIKPCVSPR